MDHPNENEIITVHPEPRVHETRKRKRTEVLSLPHLEAADPIQIKVLAEGNYRDQIMQLYQDAGWTEEYHITSEYLDVVIAGSYCFVGAFQEERMIGMARALSDGSDALVHEVIVLKEFRRMGIGNRLMQALIEYLKECGVDWIALIADRQAISFYKELGFSVMDDVVPMSWEL